MKKVLCLALCALLTLAMVPAMADTYVNSMGYSFAIEYPDVGFYVSTSNTPEYVSDQNYWKCGVIYADADDGLNWRMNAYKEDDFKGTNLYNMTPGDDDFMEYCDVVIQWFSSRNMKVKGYCDSTQDAVRFAVFEGTQEDHGQICVADTMINGWEVQIIFWAFADNNFDDYRDLTDEDFDLAGKILESFTRK